jgi:hypothetical protein
MRQMQNLPPWQGSPEWSFQIFRITSWMFSFALTTDKNTSVCYPNPLQSEARTINRYEFAAQEGRLAEGQEKEMKYTVPGNSKNTPLSRAALGRFVKADC